MICASTSRNTGSAPHQRHTIMSFEENHPWLSPVSVFGQDHIRATRTMPLVFNAQFNIGGVCFDIRSEEITGSISNTRKGERDEIRMGRA